MKYLQAVLTIVITTVCVLLVYFDFIHKSPQVKNSLLLTIEATYPEKDVITAYYTLLDEETDKPYSRSAVVQGQSAFQQIDLRIPPSQNVQLKFSQNKNQESTNIRSITISNHSVTKVIQQSELQNTLENKRIKIKPGTLYSIDLGDFKNYPVKKEYNQVLFLGLLLLFLLVFAGIYPVIGKFVFQKTNALHYRHWFLFTIAILAIKGFSKIYFSEIWAEDGSIFLYDAFHNSTFEPLFTPYAGYYHTLPRLIAIVLSYLPTALIPYTISFVCYLLFALLLTEVTKKEYRWLFKNDGSKLVLIVLWCCLPGLNEMLGNLANLHWILLAFLGLLSIKSRDKSYSAFDYVILFLAISSEGAALLFIPVFLFKVVLKYYEGKSLKNSTVELVVVALIGLFFLLNIQAKTEQSSLFFSIDLLKIWGKNFSAMLVSFPFLGDHITMQLAKHSLLLKLVLIVSLAVLGYTVIKMRQSPYFILSVLLVCVSMFPVLVSLARAKNAVILSHYFNYQNIWWTFRYSFFLPFFSALLWMIVVDKVKRKGVRVYLCFHLMVIALFVNSSRFFNPPLASEHLWLRQAVQIDAARSGALDQNKLDVKIYPDKWWMEVERSE